jgi:hypothetical protein
MAAGDVVNTASRLQSAAPVNGVLVGERTYRATRQVIDYRPATAVAAKGKAQPIPVWEALGARTPEGAEVREPAVTRLVDRQREIALLADGLARLRTERSPQLVTLVGVPGIGKTRLLAELSAMIEAEGEPVTWVVGRSRPYDSAVSFGALAEMVKAQAAIVETDGRETADDKLSRAAAEVVPRAADWVHRHLTLLVGGTHPADAPVGGDRPEEAFAAWRTFFEAVAEPQPLVLVFEDVHWADDGLLDFIDYLIEWASEAPLLVICSTRPELLERRPGRGGGKPNAVTLSLAPLCDEDTSRLLGLLVGRFLVGADRPAELLARAGGNPLYAEQYVQMLADRGCGDELSPPESIQALIAARLDVLSPIEKRIVQDAAVVGRVFWPGAIRALPRAPIRPWHRTTPRSPIWRTASTGWSGSSSSDATDCPPWPASASTPSCTSSYGRWPTARSRERPVSRDTSGRPTGLKTWAERMSRPRCWRGTTWPPSTSPGRPTRTRPASPSEAGQPCEPPATGLRSSTGSPPPSTSFAPPSDSGRKMRWTNGPICCSAWQSPLPR